MNFRRRCASKEPKIAAIAAIAEAVDTDGDFLSLASGLPAVGAWLDSSPWQRESGQGAPREAKRVASRSSGTN